MSFTRKETNGVECEPLALAYSGYIKKKMAFMVISSILLFLLLIYSISVGATNIAFTDVILSLFGYDQSSASTIIWNIRLPRALVAIVAGVGLSVSGVALQSILRNPLGSPYTLGISHACAFGAAFSVIVLGSGTMRSTGADAIMLNNPYMTTTVSFCFSLLATFTLIAIAKYRNSSPEVMILTGVALASLFTAGTMFLQYFADDVQLAAVVFWTFGDLSKTFFISHFCKSKIFPVCH